MEVKVIPTIFATNKQMFIDKFKKVKFAKDIHLDFMDGKFVSNKSVSFSDMNVVSMFKDINFGVHLMAYEPAKYLDEIKRLSIKKVLFHHEVFEKDLEITECIDLFKREKIKVFLVFNPDCDIKRALKFVHLIDGVMLMSVWPGKEGQEFIENVYEKVAFLRKNVSGINIQIDGGVKDTNIRKLVRKGANLLSVGSFISSSENPRDSYERLLYLVNN